MDRTRFSNPMHRRSARLSARTKAGSESTVRSAVPERRRRAKKDGELGLCPGYTACLFQLREYKICGFRLPQFVELFVELSVMPTLDFYFDWSVVIKWILDGDVYWATIGLKINVISGVVAGLVLGWMLAQYPVKGPRTSRSRLGWAKWKAYKVALLIGIMGLAPAAMTVLTLRTRDVYHGPKKLMFFKAAELIFQALPQSILQCVHEMISSVLIHSADPELMLAGPTSASPTASSPLRRRPSATCSQSPSSSRCSARARLSSMRRQ